MVKVHFSHFSSKPEIEKLECPLAFRLFQRLLATVLMERYTIDQHWQPDQMSNTYLFRYLQIAFSYSNVSDNLKIIWKRLGKCWRDISQPDKANGLDLDATQYSVPQTDSISFNETSATFHLNHHQFWKPGVHGSMCVVVEVLYNRRRFCERFVGPSKMQSAIGNVFTPSFNPLALVVIGRSNMVELVKSMQCLAARNYLKIKDSGIYLYKLCVTC